MYGITPRQTVMQFGENPGTLARFLRTELGASKIAPTIGSTTSATCLKISKLYSGMATPFLVLKVYLLRPSFLLFLNPFQGVFQRTIILLSSLYRIADIIKNTRKSQYKKHPGIQGVFFIFIFTIATFSYLLLAILCQKYFRKLNSKLVRLANQWSTHEILLLV